MLMRIFWLALHSVGCLAGTVFFIYALLAWRDVGYRLGGDRYSPSGSGSAAIGFCVAGIMLFAYCLFALISTTLRVKPDDATSDDKLPRI